MPADRFHRGSARYVMRSITTDRQLKTGLIVRLYDDLDDGMAVVLGKLPLGALRRCVRVVNS